MKPWLTKKKDEIAGDKAVLEFLDKYLRNKPARLETNDMSRSDRSSRLQDCITKVPPPCTLRFVTYIATGFIPTNPFMRVRNHRLLRV